MCDCNCTGQTVSDEPRWTGFVRCACKNCGSERSGERRCNVFVHPVRRYFQVLELDISSHFADAIKLGVYCGDCWKHSYLMIRRTAGATTYGKRNSPRKQNRMQQDHSQGSGESSDGDASRVDLRNATGSAGTSDGDASRADLTNAAAASPTP